MDVVITDYLRDLVAFYPQSDLQENVARLLDYAEEQFKGNGLQVQRLLYTGMHSLYAHPTGKKRSRLLLQAHIDVVPAESQPYQRKGDKITGRGTYDMLFATACYLQLMDELKDQLPDLDVGIMLSGDEEMGGFFGVDAFLRDGYSTDVCLLPDAGDTFGDLTIAAKGVHNLSIRIHGASHHGSRPWEGDNAAGKLAHFLIDAEKLFDTSDRQNSTMSISRLQAGDADNRGPNFADCRIDIRYSDKHDLRRIDAGINKLLKKYDGEVLQAWKGSDYQLDLENQYVKDFLVLYKEHVGHDIGLTKAFGSSDSRYFEDYKIPVIMIRADGGNAHGDNEWVSKRSIDQFYKLLKAYVLRTAVVK